jgi:hypothetical protein
MSLQQYCDPKSCIVPGQNSAVSIFFEYVDPFLTKEMLAKHQILIAGSVDSVKIKVWINQTLLKKLVAAMNGTFLLLPK